MRNDKMEKNRKPASAASQKRRKQRTAAERLQSKLRAFFSATLGLEKGDLRAAIAILDEQAVHLLEGHTLGDASCSADMLICDFEDRWGQIGQRRVFSMPPPPDFPSEPESIGNRIEPLSMLHNVVIAFPRTSAENGDEEGAFSPHDEHQDDL
jgi:hypothetical protein